MPRKAPDGKGVIEHRITLGNFERSTLLEQLKLQRENKLYASTIAQAGSIVGSGVLLWGIAGYLGINVLAKGKETFDNVTNTISDQLFDWIKPTNSAHPDKEARFSNAFDRLDEAIIFHRNLDQANSTAINAYALGGKAMDTADMLRLVEEARLLNNLERAIKITRARVREFQANYLRFPDGNNCPMWLGLPTWQDLLRACDAYGDAGMPDWEPLVQL